MINYQKILNKNLLNVFIDILKNIESNGLDGINHLYITFKTDNIKNIIPEWLLLKYPEEIRFADGVSGAGSRARGAGWRLCRAQMSLSKRYLLSSNCQGGASISRVQKNLLPAGFTHVLRTPK